MITTHDSDLILYSRFVCLAEFSFSDVTAYRGGYFIFFRIPISCG